MHDFAKFCLTHLAPASPDCGLAVCLRSMFNLGLGLSITAWFLKKRTGYVCLRVGPTTSAGVRPVENSPGSPCEF